MLGLYIFKSNNTTVVDKRIAPFKRVDNVGCLISLMTITVITP